ncbi:MAG: hypothetical protein P1V97_21900 [Planctomycetota bacterium]|nr:hypothetical protein [Planctomycetota bacterium]
MGSALRQLIIRELIPLLVGRFVAMLDGPDREQALLSARILGRYGGRAKGALPKLKEKALELYREKPFYGLSIDELAGLCSWAIGNIGVEETDLALPIVEEFLTRKRLAVKAMAVEALLGMGEAGRPLYSLLNLHLEALTDSGFCQEAVSLLNSERKQG